MKIKTFIAIFQIGIFIMFSGCKSLKGINLFGSVSGEPPGETQVLGVGPETDAENLGPTVAEASSENEAVQMELLAGIIKPLPWTPMKWSFFPWSTEPKNQEIVREYDEVVKFYDSAIQSSDAGKMNDAISKIRGLRKKIIDLWGKDPTKEDFINLYMDESDFYITGIKEYLGE